MKITAKQEIAIDALIAGTGDYILFRPAPQVVDKTDYRLYGCHLIKMDGGREVSISKLHYNAISQLIKKGFLVESEEITVAGGGIAYVLGDNAQKILEPLIEKYRNRESRISMTRVNEIAAKFGAKVGWLGARKLFYVESLFNDHGKRGYVGGTTKDGRPVTRINDLSADEWEDEIIECLRKM